MIPEPCFQYKESPMNIVAINGSPTGSKGSTGRLLTALIEGAHGAGAEVTLFELGWLTVKPCTSCRTCQRIGTCVIEDDYQRIKAAMIAADGIVLASPNYISSVSAQMKALLDRCFSMFHCQALHGKYGAVVIASGSPMYQTPQEYLMNVVGSFGCWNAGSVATGGGLLDDLEQAPDILKEASDLGNRLAEAIKSMQRFPEQAEALEQSFEIMRWLVEEHKDIWPYEYEYWQKHWSNS
jgi:multimeric flavodoxin WrbA